MQDVFKASDFPDLIVGLSGPDDAAAWRLDETRSLLLTTDFFTPIVDDPYAYGAIAAANSLSDIYAMGGKPFLALNITALPEDLPADVTSAILKGGAEKAREAGVIIAGGHTVKDPEPKYGLVVVGFVETRRILTKAGLRPGDSLILTKPLGFGLITTALKRDLADPADVSDAIRWMSTLNRSASEVASAFELKAGTDITGYGLLGHGLEMADASGVALEIQFSKVPLLKGASKYVAKGALAAGLRDNRKYFGPRVTFAASVPEDGQMILFDPQTSGGLLLGVPPARLEGFLRRAAHLQLPAHVIGVAREGSGIRVE